jgi:hypothetical protein
MWRGLAKTARVWWGDSGSTRLKAFAPYSWVPILTIASLSLLVSFCNYRFQVSGRPELQFTNGTINPKERTLIGYWHNPGKMTAWRSKAKLFDVNDKGNRANQPFADIDIVGAGPKVFANMGAQMTYQFPTDRLPSRILVCVTYEDENQKSYAQAFLLNPKTDVGILVEQMPPIGQNCP